MSDELKIRPYQSSDEHDVARLWSAALPDDRPWNAPARYVERKLAVQPDLFLVGELDGRAVATVIGGYDGVRGWVYHLVVEPALRGRGHGRAMMRAVEARLAALGCPKINLQIVAANAAVARFYESLGYVVEERVSMGKRIADG